LLDGFFPECDSLARPYRAQTALKEWGLPYTPDGAVTRHLADFLRARPRVDAILFNGGSLHPEPVRQRICELVGRWQGGRSPLALENADPDLAVARGAALFGKSIHRNADHIEAGAARSVFLEVLRERPDQVPRDPAALDQACRRVLIADDDGRTRRVERRLEPGRIIFPVVLAGAEASTPEKTAKRIGERVGPAAGDLGETVDPLCGASAREGRDSIAYPDVREPCGRPAAIK
jgi:hypothetical protein